MVDFTGLLSLIAFSPLLGILILLFIHRDKEKTIKTIAIIVTLISLLLTLLLVSGFNYGQAGYQYEEWIEWIQFQIPVPWIDEYTLPMQINYEMGVDGLAVALILLTAVIAFLSAIASTAIKERWKEYFILFFLMQIGMFGVFMAQNLFLFFIFFELTIIPMYFLIGIWGYFKREHAANQFLIYNGIGSAAMLLAFVAIYMSTGTFNMEEIAMLVPYPEIMSATYKMGIFLALLFAFGVKLPIFPLHTWMLKVHVQAPPAIVMMHSGILLKLGAYGLIRIGMGIFPDQWMSVAYFIALLGVINILYGAVLAFVQRDLKMVMAYSSISHMGIVLIGLAAVNYSGIQGAIFQTISHGLISALLFFIIGIIYKRTQTSMIDDLGGLAKSMPIIAGVFLAAAMANLGLPGMSGFISEFLAFLGFFNEYPVLAAVGVIGIIITAVYLLRAVLNSTFGPTKDAWAELKDARGLEYVPMVVLLGLIILIGVYPSSLADMIDGSILQLIDSLTARMGG